MQEPVCVEPEETLEAAALRLKRQDVGSLPVCEGRRVVGMLTDRDVLIRSAASRNNIHAMKAREAMSIEVHCCFADDPVEKAAAIMADNHVRRLPVLDRDQNLVGVISAVDLADGPSGRAPFEVVFYKQLHDSNGHPHHTELRRVIIGGKHTKDEAIAAAIQVEQERHGSWKAFADGYDVVGVHHDGQGKTVEEVEKTSEKAERVRRRAYALWERAGHPDNSQVKDWVQASQEIEAEDAAAHRNAPGA